MQCPNGSVSIGGPAAVWCQAAPWHPSGGVSYGLHLDCFVVFGTDNLLKAPLAGSAHHQENRAHAKHVAQRKLADLQIECASSVLLDSLQCMYKILSLRKCNLIKPSRYHALLTL